jgi:sterol desaturase/sphingolipid hydroxylase (fatty acid hydroxylase superfamily)
MDALGLVYKEVTSFFGLQGLVDLVKAGDYTRLRTVAGIRAVVDPIAPLLLVIEFIRALVLKKFKGAHYKMNMTIYVFNRFLSNLFSIAAVAFCIGYFSRFAMMKTSFTWYWLIYGYITWELSHFVYHYLSHKVRLFWCLHASHHAPEHMNMTVSYSHFFLEDTYANMIRVPICIVMGVSPPLLFLIMFIDGTWGAFNHVGEGMLKDGRLGFLSRFILTPSHHRVHHAKNPLYMDTNFCNLLNMWDRIFRTYRPERVDLPPVYGITREMRPGSFVDVYFGEILALGTDVIKAPGIRNKFLYIVMPPGWSHLGDHKTSKARREQWLREQELASRQGGVGRAGASRRVRAY